MNREQAKATIEKLIERYKEHYKEYHLADYNEQKARQDFINPFFKALGWDIDNEKGDSEAYREVIYEDKVKIKGKAKAPDYGFRLAGSGSKRLFYLEAKKPAIAVKTNKEAAYQLRRYGSSAQVPVSILTNFEDFVVYDCTKVPRMNDSASVARVKHIGYEDYLKEFDFIYDTFSHEAVTKGRFDKFVQGSASKKGTDTLDKRFVESLDQWRKYLATSIALNNRKLNDEEINFAVQQTIDRLIFLRFCEDRSVEPYAQLQQAVEKGDAYKNLFHLFELADAKYNSGLFDFDKDTITPNLKVDNKVVRNVINEMYYPLCNYEFSVIPVEILGNAYEQFLGKVIRITPARSVKIEEKPEVRKAGGVYYTPQYIVEYIVKNTVGKLIEGKTPKEIEKIKIVDPACGSGSFLLGAFDYLLQYHTNWYHQKGYAEKKGKDNPLTPQGTLTTHEKKRILKSSIYGVDLDANAVEVSKLSLLLKCMEGETQASIAQQISLFHERVLPDLDNNIKDGNSLIDTDFYDSEMDLGYERKVKPFNWQKSFPEVFKQGGFDVVVGNPPYGAAFSSEDLNYFKSKFKTTIWRGESYLLFIERALQLLKVNGPLGFIIPDTLLNLGFTSSTRQYILQNSSIQEIVSLPTNVFAGATVDTILLFAKKRLPTESFHAGKVNVKLFNKKAIITDLLSHNKSFSIKTETWHRSGFFNVQSDEDEQLLIKKIEKDKVCVESIANMFSGIKVYEVGKGVPPQTVKVRDTKPYTSDRKLDKAWSIFYEGKDVGRYQITWKENSWINYGQWLAAPREPENFEGEKILIRKIVGKTLISTYVPTTSYCNTLLFVLKIKDPKFSYASLLGILNSNLIGWFFRKKFQISDADTFPQIMIRDILQFPLPSLKQEFRKRLDDQVNLMLALNHEFLNTKLPSKIEQLKQRIAHNEDKINRLVYELYDLTEEEIKLVEQSINE